MQPCSIAHAPFKPMLDAFQTPEGVLVYDHCILALEAKTQAQSPLDYCRQCLSRFRSTASGPSLTFSPAAPNHCGRWSASRPYPALVFLPKRGLWEAAVTVPWQRALSASVTVAIGSASRSLTPLIKAPGTCLMPVTIQRPGDDGLSTQN